MLFDAMGLLKNLQTWAIRQALKAHPEVVCPRCQTRFAPPPPESFKNYNDPMICPNCGRQITLQEITGSSEAGAAQLNTPTRVPQPMGSEVRVDELQGGMKGFRLPTGKRSCFLLVFTLFWNGIIGFIIFAATTGLGDNAENPFEDWWGFLFFLPFILVGLALAVLTVKAQFEKVTVLLSPQAIMLERSTLGWNRIHRIETEEIYSVEAKEFYQQNYEPVYGIEIRSNRKKLRFGSSLKEEDKQWLIGEIRGFLAENGVNIKGFLNKPGGMS